jgi:hypothetical protein
LYSFASIFERILFADSQIFAASCCLFIAIPYRARIAPIRKPSANRSSFSTKTKKAWSRFACSPRLRATTPFSTISTNDPRPSWDVSVRLIPVEFESGSFSRENKRRISKFPVAPHHSVRGYVTENDSKKKQRIRRLEPEIDWLTEFFSFC